MAATSSTLTTSDKAVAGGGLVLCVLAGVAHLAGWQSVVAFVLAGAAVTALAALVGRSVDQLGDRFGPGATGVLQSALGNLPELFISIFALRQGLTEVVRAALIGSILANLLLVLGIAFVVGGLRYGPQRLGSARAKTIPMLMLLSVTAMVFPSVAHWTHGPAAAHEKAFSLIVSVVLLALFAASLPSSLRREQPSADDDGGEAAPAHEEPPRWSVALAVGMLAAAGLGAAFVSDWFVDALTPAMHAAHISQAFAGLVIVAIAGNAIENVVGVQLAARGQSEYAFSVVLNSPMQIALVLAPVLVIVSQVFGLASLTLVFSPMLVVALMLAVVLAAFISIDGESTWLEGATLIGLYVVVATAFWWG